MVEYCGNLNSVLKTNFPRVKASLPNLADGAQQYLNPGNFVVVKDFWRNLTEGEMNPEAKGPTQAMSRHLEVEGHQRKRPLLGPHIQED